MMRSFFTCLFFTASSSVSQNVEWRADLAATQLHVSDDYVFAQGSQSIWSLELGTGSIHKEIPFANGNSEAFAISLQAYESKSTTHFVLSFNEDTGDVMCFDTRLNEVLWQMRKIVAPPVMDRDYGVGIYLLTAAGQLLVVDSMSRFPVFAIDHNMPIQSTLYMSLDNDKLYIVSPYGHVQIHSALDGRLLASPHFEETDQALVVGDTLLLSADGIVSAYSMLDDTPLLWKSCELGDAYTVQPMDDDKHILLLTTTGLHKIKLGSGKVKWTYASASMDIMSYTTQGDDVYVVMKLLEPSYLVKLNGQSGQDEWTFVEQGCEILESRVHDDAIYVITSDASSSTHLLKLSDHKPMGIALTYQ